MQCDRISEAAFLLVELRYTLAQLRAQLKDLDKSARPMPLSDGKTIDSILEVMARNETGYQAHYAALLQLSAPKDDHEETMGGFEAFERKRRQTIDMLNRLGDAWQEALVESVKQQVASDRENATRIAEYRRELLEGRNSGL